METIEFNELLKIVESTPLFELDTEHLNQRLLKGKTYILKNIGYKNYKGITRAEGNIAYLKGLKGFLENIRNYLNCCRYFDDDRVKIDLRAFLFKQINEIDGLICYWIDEREAINLRAEKEKTNTFEAENIEILNEGLK